MLSSKAATASCSTAARSAAVSSMAFMRPLYSCLKRLGLVTPGKEKKESPSGPLSPRDFWAGEFLREEYRGDGRVGGVPVQLLLERFVDLVEGTQQDLRSEMKGGRGG
ncbi:hypothetical protein EYF80_031191 [Liparis tanakae]|uniref:Uncharacterized protein n=1 Tax=Liparis tanakae TaxID=230148 RepID=A0A4Z2GZ45_9TELE|nr:hypothetical protein EYF80_031191 [Liparis tanakae]